MKKLLIILVALAVCAQIYAGDVSRKGTTGADQLLIPVGARGIATGGAFLANLTGLESIFYNPAGLDVTKSTEGMFSYMTYLGDINVSYFAAGASLGDIGSIALSFKAMDFGDIDVTTTDYPDGTGQSYSPSFLVGTLTFSKVLTDRISVGTNLKMISETIMNTSAAGFAIDIGVQYKFNSKLFLGASVKNIGPNMQYTGPDLIHSTTIPGADLGTGPGSFMIETETFQIPSYFELSLGYKYDINMQNDLLVASTFTANNSLEDLVNFGVEYGYMDMFFLRGGYRYQVENIDEAVYGFTLGAGVSYKLSGDVGIVVDYAFREAKEFPADNHIMTVKLSFLQ